MGFKNQCFCTVWTNKFTNKVIDKYEKYAEVSITIRKKKDNGYETDFSGKVRFVGKAFQIIKDIELAEKDRLKLLEVEVTNRYDKQRQTTYTNYICWDFECLNDVKQSAPQEPEVIGELQPLEDMGLDGLPF